MPIGTALAGPKEVLPSIAIEGNVTSGEVVAVVVVNNPCPYDIVLISPRSPDLIIDAAKCTIVLNTKVLENVYYYSFEPELVTIKSGTTERIEIKMKNPNLSKTKCKSWILSSRYAYLTGDDADGLKYGTSQDVVKYLLEHQRLITSPE